MHMHYPFLENEHHNQSQLRVNCEDIVYKTTKSDVYRNKGRICSVKDPTGLFRTNKGKSAKERIW